jgi:hypothetical protein
MNDLFKKHVESLVGNWIVDRSFIVRGRIRKAEVASIGKATVVKSKSK